MIAGLRRTSFALSRRAGLTTMIGDSRWRRERLLILCYHGVSIDDEHEWNPRLYVSQDMLARRFAILRRLGCTVLGLEDAVDRLYANDLPPRAVALTFDDGYQDFASRAYPLLQEYGYAATVYVPTFRVMHNFPIAQLFVAYALWKQRHATLDARGILGLSGTYDLSSATTRRVLVARLLAGFDRKHLDPRGKSAVCRTVVERLGLDYDALVASGLLRLMDAGQLRQLAQDDRISFELHTHQHRTPDDAALFQLELTQNRTHLEAMTGRAARHFCYPSGVYRSWYPDLLKAQGVRSATTCDPDMATRSSNAWLLPRFVDTTMVSDAEFEAWATGAACWLPRRTRLAHQRVA